MSQESDIARRKILTRTLKRRGAECRSNPDDFIATSEALGLGGAKPFVFRWGVGDTDDIDDSTSFKIQCCVLFILDAFVLTETLFTQ